MNARNLLLAILLCATQGINAQSLRLAAVRSLTTYNGLPYLDSNVIFYPNASTPGDALGYGKGTLNYDTLLKVLLYNSNTYLSRKVRWHDAQGKTLRVMHQDYNGTQYIVRKWDSMAYDANGNRIYESNTNYSTSSVLTSASRSYKSYDAAGNLIKDSAVLLNTVTNVWSPNFLNHRTYTSNNLPLANINLSYNTTTMVWDTTSSTVNHYNSQSQNDTITYYSWVSNVKTPYLKYYFVYNANGDQIHFRSHNWSNGWVPGLQSYSHFDALNRNTHDSLQSYNTSTNTWRNYYRYLFSYIGNTDNRTEYLYQQFTAANTYRNEMVDSDYYRPDGLPDFRTRRTWDTVANAWRPTKEYDIQYYYEVYTPNGIMEVVENELSVNLYPNPATQMFHVVLDEKDKYATIRVLNAEGRLIAQQKANPTNGKCTLYTTGWAKGLYWVTVESSNGKATKALAIQ